MQLKWYLIRIGSLGVNNESPVINYSKDVLGWKWNVGAGQEDRRISILGCSDKWSESAIMT